MKDWNLRTELLTLAHRWYWVLASFLLGVLLGWLVSLIWPAPYRATQDLYVGLNAARATRDLYVATVAEEQFRNLDDYKNWQMGQLDALALSDAYLAETLTRLQAADATWMDVEVPALRAMLSLAWRNTGAWHFRAQADDPQRAAQAVSAWSQVVTDETTTAVAAARQMVGVEHQMRTTSRTWLDLGQRLILLQDANKTLADWMLYFDAQPPDAGLTPAQHWLLLAQVTTAAAWNSGWSPLLEAAPALGSYPAHYQVWLSQVIALIEAELAVLPAQIASLADDYAALTAEYAALADESRALSATLEVGPIVEQPPVIEHLRPTGTLLLIGGMLGLLVGGFFWLVQVTRKSAS